MRRIAANAAKVFPPYALLIESYAKAQEVVTRDEQLDSVRRKKLTGAADDGRLALVVRDTRGGIWIATPPSGGSR